MLLGKVIKILFKCTLTFMLILSLMATSYGQRIVKGKVTASDTGESLPGANFIVKGTTRGATTDLDGSFSIELKPEERFIVFSFVGYEDQEVEVTDVLTINVALKLKSTTINEVVVIGYGTSKVKDLTAPVATIKSEELSKQATANPMQALQGKMAGVQIINSGVPGSNSSVKIRGVGSIGEYANPLYIVDGAFVENIDFLSSGDIEDLTVLKDASASAIYGVRAANGVVLVTTKKGKTGKPTISYDSYVGIQVPVNIMPLASKNQYVKLMNEANVNTTGYVPLNADNFPTSTDWYRKLVRNAGISSHNIDISGLNNKTSYSFGSNYFYQKGIMNTKNDYQRFNIRARLDQKVNNYIKIGVNTVISKYQKNIPNDAAFFQAYVNPPVYSVYDDNNTAAYPVKFGAPQMFGFGNSYGNPVAATYYNDDFEIGNKFILSANIEFNIINEKLTFKTSYNQDINNWNYRNYTPEFYVGGSQSVRKSSLSKTFGNSSRQILDNLLTFKNAIGKHSFNLLLGQSTRIEKTSTISGSAIDVPGFDEQSKYLTTGSYKDRYAWDGGSTYNGLSFFTRGTYNFNDKYLATFTFRVDGSSKYQEKWGYFPSIGIGWNLTQEDFLKNNAHIQYLKVRASWGLLGNDNVPANSAVILGQTGAGSSGIFGDQLVDGIGAQTVIQNYLKWEVVNEFDIGVDFTVVKNKLSGGFDYYHRVTNNVVFYAPIATGGGVAELLGNNGSVLNSGFELNLNWDDKMTENINYHIGMNATTIHNEVLTLEGRDNIPSGKVRGNNYTTRTQVGHPIGSFYGFEIVGVYKTESEALLDPVSQAIKGKGFFKYRDQNGDNVINDKDKVFLGSAIPWLIAGIDFGMNYKQFDFSIAFQGQLGNKILNAKRMNRDVFTDGNYDKDFYDNRWTSSSKSDKYPSAEAYNFSYTQQANDFFVENGSYIRIQNIQIGYTTKKIKFIPMLRVYISAQRPLTLFSYKGFTPEISGSPIASGIDNNVYPMQAIYSMGIKMNF